MLFLDFPPNIFAFALTEDCAPEGSDGELCLLEIVLVLILKFSFILDGADFFAATAAFSAPSEMIAAASPAFLSRCLPRRVVPVAALALASGSSSRWKAICSVPAVDPYQAQAPIRHADFGGVR